MDNIMISVIIPTFNEEKYIAKCVQSLLDNAPPFKFEVLVVDGGSIDRTREIVNEINNTTSNVKLMENEKRFAPFAFNIGIKNAKGKYIIILGAHSYVEKNFLEENYLTITKNEADCVGGRIHSISDSPIAEDIKLALSSPFGVGNARFRYSTKPGYVDTVAFGCYKKEVFDKIGLFDEDLIRNQDDEFNQRLNQAGGKVFFNPKIISYYYVRGDIKKLYKQYFQYGFWKVVVQKKRKQVASVRHLIPMLFVLFLVVGGLLSTILPVARFLYLSILLLYVLGALLAATKLSPSPIGRIRIPILFFVIHMAYGLGYWKGLYKHIFSKKRTDSKMFESTR